MSIGYGVLGLKREERGQTDPAFVELDDICFLCLQNCGFRNKQLALLKPKVAFLFRVFAVDICGLRKLHSSRDS